MKKGMEVGEEGMRIIREVVAKHALSSPRDILEPSKFAHIVEARWEVIYRIAAEMPRATFGSIARFMNMDHSSVLNAANQYALRHNLPAIRRVKGSTIGWSPSIETRQQARDVLGPRVKPSMLLEWHADVLMQRWIGHGKHVWLEVPVADIPPMPYGVAIPHREAAE